MFKFNAATESYQAIGCDLEMPFNKGMGLGGGLHDQYAAILEAVSAASNWEGGLLTWDAGNSVKRGRQKSL